MTPTIILWLSIIVMAAGAIGTFLPVIPGTPLIFIAALGYGYYEEFTHVTPTVLAVMFGLMIIAFLIDYFAGVIGAKKYGATRYGTWGAFIGGIIGILVLSIPGLIVGPFAGAVIGEVLSGRKAQDALRVGLGTVIGLAGGAFVKFLLALTMVVVFLTSLF